MSWSSLRAYVSASSDSAHHGNRDSQDLGCAGAPLRRHPCVLSPHRRWCPGCLSVLTSVKWPFTDSGSLHKQQHEVHGVHPPQRALRLKDKQDRDPAQTGPRDAGRASGQSSGTACCTLAGGWQDPLFPLPRIPSLGFSPCRVPLRPADRRPGLPAPGPALPWGYRSLPWGGRFHPSPRAEQPGAAA